MTSEEIGKRLDEELAIAHLRFAVDPDRLEQWSELDKTLRRHSKFRNSGEIPSDLRERKTIARTA
jgi:hypothetical protein